MTKLVLERSFTASPNIVFAFVTRGENLSKWWGPEGMTIPDAQLDFTNTGPWHSVMANADGGRHKVSGQVNRVDPPRSVEFSWGWHDENDLRGHESQVRFDVADNGKGGTLFTLTHSGLVDDESAASHTDGWTSSLRKLERLD